MKYINPGQEVRIVSSRKAREIAGTWKQDPAGSGGRNHRPGKFFTLKMEVKMSFKLKKISKVCILRSI
jgi:hypothetical protein